jgi:cholesterol oxidase
MAGGTSFSFTETMRGYVSLDETTYEAGYARGKQVGTGLLFRLTISIDDIDRFVQSPQHAATATGYVDCAALGGRLTVEQGWFHLFLEAANQNQRKMRYRLFLRDPGGNPLTLSGFKDVQDQVGPDLWRDTTTLYVNLYHGHLLQEDESGAGSSGRLGSRSSAASLQHSPAIAAAGILRIEKDDFLRQLTTFRAFGPSPADRRAAFEKFGRLFLGSLWKVYGPACMPAMSGFEREIPRFTTEGVENAEITVHPFQTADRLGLSMLRFLREPCNDVVVIIHGLTTSSDMFIMPEHYNLVQYLLNHGFTDVWSLDFRMSNRFPYNLQRHRYNLDDIALFDYPPAMAKVREHIGMERRIHVICHCLGSVSFMMSLFGKAVDGIASVISNSVSLTPRVPGWSQVKLTVGPFLVENFTSISYVNPYWRREPGFGLGKLLAWFVSLYHRECDVPECHMLSFMWGTGFPAVYLHENLHDITHRRGGDLYGGVSLHYYRHVRKMVAADHTAVKFDPRNPKYDALPNNYLQHAAEVTTPILFITGQQNHIFLDSNIICHQRLEKLAPGRHELEVFANYGHQDVFMGKNNHQDVFPRLVTFLERHSGRRQRRIKVVPHVRSPAGDIL